MSSATQPPANNSDPLYDVEQAGQYLGRGARFVRRLVHEKRITFVRMGGRIRIRRSTLDAFLAAHTRPAERTGPPADKGPIPPAKYVRKLTTEAAPSGRTVHAERSEPVASSAPVTPGKADTENTGPAAG